MAKCSICGSRKGKRRCKISDTLICSLCCGESRQADTCSGCIFFKEPKAEKKYTNLPMIPLPQMENDIELQSYANAIESTFCSFDQSENRMLKDPTILSILELLLDKYHFNQQPVEIEDKMVGKGFSQVLRSIGQDLADVPTETLTKIIGSIYFVAKRRSEGNREYLDFIHDYVGIRIAGGLRLIPDQFT